MVAHEVKQLAKQTGQATEDISRKIGTIQAESTESQSSSATKTVKQHLVSAIAAAVENGRATTEEMGHNVSEAARGSEEISRNIVGVAEAAQNTAAGATESRKAANDLADLATRLQSLVTKQT